MLFKKNEDFYDVVGYSKNSLLPLRGCYKKSRTYSYATVKFNSREGTFACPRNQIAKIQKKRRDQAK